MALSRLDFPLSRAEKWLQCLRRGNRFLAQSNIEIFRQNIKD